jgi:sorbitol/mannitol transport system permease protein
MSSRHSTPIRPAQVLRTIAAWGITLFLFFPLGWLLLTAFKTELHAAAAGVHTHAGELSRSA